MCYLFMVLSYIFSSVSLAQTTGTLKNIPETYFNKSVKVARTDSQILLQGSDCKLLKQEAHSIGIWGKNIELAKSAECKCEEEKCQVDITSFAPKIVKEKQGICNLNDGPNCWNASLVSAGVIDHLRYASDDEMKFWMESPLCTERKPGEEKLPGDIIAIRKSTGAEYHGFVYISENLSFSKNGYMRSAPYSLQSPENVYALYDVPESCREVYKKPNIKCDFYSNILHCISIEEYYKKNPEFNSEQKETLKTLDDLECSMSDLVNSPDFDSKVVKLAQVGLLAVVKIAEDNLKTKLNEYDQFIWQTIKLRAESSFGQSTSL